MHRQPGSERRIAMPHPLLHPRKPQVSSYVPAHPWHLEDYYVRQLWRRVAVPLMRITAKHLHPVVMAYRAPSERQDSAHARTDDDVNRFIRAIGDAQLEYMREVDTDAQAQDAIDDTAPKVEKFTLAQQRKALRVIGVDSIGSDLFLHGERVKWTQANTELIRSIPTEYFPHVQKRVIQAVHSGMRHETLAKQLQGEILPMSKTRASVIARDQVSKYNGALAKAQQQSVGVQKYQWRAVNDRRTRETHLALDGTTQSWDSPPAIGHPGEPILCRCVSLPLI